MSSVNLLKMRVFGAGASLLAATACTGQLPGSFSLLEQQQTFSSSQDVNTKIDLLWVVDNSASMDVTQEKLRTGFASFASKYMKPTWDIRVAVITTDVYMAHSSFSTYRSTVISASTVNNWTSTYINSRLGSWVNPTWNPTLVNTGDGRFTNGITFGDLIPSWGQNFSRLLPGAHDGPINSLCVEWMPYFMDGPTQCQTRDAPGANTGVAKCLNPGAGEDAITQCVNTVQNDTVHSGKAIIETMPPSGTAGDAAWTQQLVNDFMVNVSTGSSGQGSERGFSSLLQLIEDNESTATAFFRKGALHGVIFVSDEDDQSMPIPSAPGAGFSPVTDYYCDTASITTLNPSNAALVNAGGLCCAGGSCRYTPAAGGCTAKTVGSEPSVTMSTCPDPTKLIAVSDVKSQLDTFFSAVDTESGGDAADPSYFVASIVAKTNAGRAGLQTLRDTDDQAIAGYRLAAVDYGVRYIELADLVGNGSMSLDISETNYDSILESIGQSILEKKATFVLSRKPVGGEEMIVSIVHADDSETVVPSNIITVTDNTIRITDLDFVLSLQSTDRISIVYIPKTVTDR